MITNKTYPLLSAFLIFVVSVWSGMATAKVINYSGTLGSVTDNTGARYSGSTIGQIFSGSFSYGMEAEATTDPSSPEDYDFTSPPYGGLITDGTTATSGSSSEPVQVTVDDDVPLDQETADLLNTLLGTLLVAGNEIDIADIDTTFVTSTGGAIVFGLSFITPDSTGWSGNDFGNFPPESGNIDRAIFFIEEYDASDNLLFSGYGELSTVTVVPNADDTDGDGIADGDGSNPCSGGNTVDCDDNCVATSNPDQADGDGDAAGDVCDNCTSVTNAGQLDTDGDNIGNQCDCDFSQDNFCGFPDFNLFIGCYNAPTGGDPICDAADMNGDGFVGFPDFNLFIGGYSGPPGPSGVAP